MVFTQGCHEVEETLTRKKAETPAVPKWAGSPFLEWESPKFHNDIILRGIFPAGVYGYEGKTTAMGQLNPDKGILLTYADGRLIWRRALIPHFVNPISPFSSRIVTFQTSKKVEAMLTWVRGDLFRVQEMASGSDLWNRPACLYPTRAGKYIAGYCFNKVHLMDPDSGHPVKKIATTLPVTNLWSMGKGLLIQHGKGSLSYMELPGGRVHEPLERPEFKHIAVKKDRVFVLYREERRFVLEMLKYKKPDLYGGGLVSAWKIFLSLFPATFWVRIQEDQVIHPTGLDCMMSRTMQSGMELWTSCGLYLFNPPAYDDFGMYMLSSRRVGELRPIVFIDGDNGLQTNLFTSHDGGNETTVDGKFIAPGKVRNGLIYAIHKHSKVVAVRVSAPDTKEND
ncbi:hypothetical protein KKF84_19475 [Myxococcota bacterium]|nr:hypothetical protein [Myxococcota bacterium]